MFHFIVIGILYRYLTKQKCTLCNVWRIYILNILTSKMQHAFNLNFILAIPMDRQLLINKFRSLVRSINK